ncbi:Sorting nexin-19 [Triplophysa tibetana]|uniref:Sorting nexin-19 n=1 Tax=Triplophysa tibetana TaxID=1572043 RepID=A0A5A9P3N2_9TELE|nr:Sorting nexin-19 [Triplophysa tibetana]
MPGVDDAGPISWTLSELLGQRSILGVVVLITWLVLFHLLVNVWLLCIFTSLLVVLGGWLGSRVALNANSLLYLEHFLPMSESPHAHTSTDSEQRLDWEIQSAVNKALQEFLLSWYSSFASKGGDEFEWEVRNVMLEAAGELKRRAKLVDRKALAQRVLVLCGGHLQSFSHARELHQKEREGNSFTLWRLYSEVDMPHPALASPAAQLCYSRALVDLLMHVLIQQSHLETRTGRYMVGELITCNVLLPLVTRISNPDWLNQMIVDVFTKSTDEEETVCPSPQQLPPADLGESCRSFCECDPPINFACPDTSSMQTAWSISTGPLHDSSESSFQSQWSSDENVQRKRSSMVLFPEKIIQNTVELLRSPYRTSRLYGHIDCDLDSPTSEEKKSSIESLKQTNSEEDSTENFCDCISPSDFCGLVCLEEETLGLLGKCFKQNIISEPTSCPERTVAESAEGPLTQTNDSNPGNLGRDLAGFENIEGPVSIHNLHITGAFTAKTQKTNSTLSYTLYSVKYETAADSEASTADQTVSYHVVNRRYSEFLNLQTRLEERPDLKKVIKYVKGPKKLFPDLPFSNVDTDKVEARRSQLESFLRKLCAIPEVANSEEVREFLALNTDARTAFQKKPLSSRIDKMMENIVDTLKTAFPRSEPQSPTDEGDPQRKPRLRFSSKIAPLLNVPDLRPKVTYSFSETCSVLKGFSLSDLEGFLDEQEMQVDGVLKNPLRSREEQKPVEKRWRGTDTALADIALNILCLLMKDRWSWLCTENIHKTIRLLFGTFIERWIEVGIAHLTSAPCWVIYLRVLQDAVWPGGELPVGPRPYRSPEQREKSRLQCLQCLIQLFPELITDMLGTEKCRLVWEQVLESLQDPSINRHLVYCIFDLLLEFLVPEFSKETFQRSFLQSLPGDVERTPTSA